MAIDITKGTHNIFFPSKLLASMGGKHQYDITLTANHDNGTLVKTTIFSIMSSKCFYFTRTQ